MKKTAYVFILVIILTALALFMPMPHGGNLAEGFIYEIQQYFSAEHKEAREQEKKAKLLQKEVARESGEKFERENPQFFPKSK